MICQLCSNEIGHAGVLCSSCYASERHEKRVNKIKRALEEENLGLLDHHGAVIDNTVENFSVEMDTPEEFEQVKEQILVKKKLDFAARATAPKCGSLARLQACTEPIKKHLSESFQGWIQLGIPLAQEDPLLLNVVVETWNGTKVTEASLTFDFKDANLPLAQIFRLNENLYKLPDLFKQVENALRTNRNVVVHLKWWGTAKQMTHVEFMKDLHEQTIKGLSNDKGTVH
jgi:hypothetical protein